MYINPLYPISILVILSIPFMIMSMLEQRLDSSTSRIRTNRLVAMLLGSKSDRIIWTTATIQIGIVINLLCFAALTIVYGKPNFAASFLVSGIVVLLLRLRKPNTDFSCAEITGYELSRLFTVSDTVQPVTEFLEKNFGKPIKLTDSRNYEVNGVSHLSSTYQWQCANRKYQLITVDSMACLAKSGCPDLQGPSLTKTIGCYGPPTFYSVGLVSRPKQGLQLWVDIFYLDIGVMIFARPASFPSGGIYNRNDIFRSMLDSIPVRGIGWASPSTIEEMDWKYWTPDWSPTSTNQATWYVQRAWYYDTFRPWPGDPGQMEITHFDI